MQLKKNMEVVLDIASFGAEGEGVGKWEGMPVFVPFALPGEQARVLIVKTEKRYAFGKALEILTPSPLRAEPVCPYYRLCGGCACQHMCYEAQLQFKREQVENCMRHIAGLDVPVQPVLGMDDPWHYRNKTAVPVTEKDGKIEIGYFARRSHRVIDMESCPLSNPVSDRICAAVRQWMTEEHIPAYREDTQSGFVRHIVTRVNRRGQAMAVLVINGKKLKKADTLLSLLKKQAPELVSLCISPNCKPGNVILGEDDQVVWGQERLEDTLCGSRFQLSPLSFFQINPTQTEKLYQTALDFANLTGTETVADLYCGAGTISLLLARHAAHVAGVEIVPDAIRDAKTNAALNDIQNVQFYCGASEKVLPELVSQGLRPDVVVLDPPRKGAEKSVLDAIAACSPRRVVYVSCNPATLARDVRLLYEGGYHVARCQPVDMFCQTAGVESVCLLTRTQIG